MGEVVGGGGSWRVGVVVKVGVGCGGMRSRGRRRGEVVVRRRSGGTELLLCVLSSLSLPFLYSELDEPI